MFLCIASPAVSITCGVGTACQYSHPYGKYGIRRDITTQHILIRLLCGVSHSGAIFNHTSRFFLAPRFLRHSLRASLPISLRCTASCLVHASSLPYYFAASFLLNTGNSLLLMMRSHAQQARHANGAVMTNVSRIRITCCSCMCWVSIACIVAYVSGAAFSALDLWLSHVQ